MTLAWEQSQGGGDEAGSHRVTDGGARSGGDQEALQAAALARVGNAVMITDPAGTIVWVNDAFVTLSGYTAEEAIGQTPRILRSGVHDQRHYEHLWSTILQQRTWRGEVVERRKDGPLYRVMQTITPLVDDHGAISHFVAVHEDVTALRTSEARLRALFDHALDAIVLFDADGRLVDANPAACALTGYTSEELADMTLAHLVPPEEVAHLEQHRARFEAEGEARGRLPIRPKNGGHVDLDYQAVADVVPGANLLIGRDVTAQRRAEAEQRFQAQLLAAVGDAVVAVDLDGVVAYWNRAAERLYGWRADEVLGLRATDVIAPPAQRGRTEEILAWVRGGQHWAGELAAAHRDGTRRSTWMTSAPYLDGSGGVAGIICTANDLGDLKRSEQLLELRARQQTAIAQLGQLALELIDDDPRAVAERAEAKVVEVLGPDVEAHVAWSSGPPQEHAPGGQEAEVAIGTTAMLRVRHTGGERLEAADHEFLRSVAHVIHATAQRDAANAQLEHMATHDGLTGLPNRALFLDRLEHTRASSQRSGEPFAVLFLDLDGLKSVNDGLGHDAGDGVLRLVAARLQGVVRPGDTVARFGGDEFAVLCPGMTSEDEAAAVAERIQASLAAGFRVTETQLAVSASIGIVLGDQTTEASELLRDADTAMYWAKDSGRNRVEHFNSRMQEQARSRFKITAALRDALDHDGVLVAYQPSFELASGRIVGVEALARLPLPTGEAVPPDEFIWIAEETGMIGPLGEQVLERACADARAWIAADPHFMLSVNLSPRQLAHPEIAAVVERILTEAGIAPELLWLEVTETSLLSGPGVHAAMRHLRLLGVKLAIDDFGTGYSSLVHLRQMPVDMLKIDRSFVSGMHADIQDHALVGAAIDLAHSFALSTTAEGVETPEQRDELCALGCQYAQGYLWSPPVDADAITSMLHTSAERPPD